jgi:CheY-like chemotaxis protein/predicted Fe-Mo cluster-binding NifX family protein
MTRDLAVKSKVAIPVFRSRVAPVFDYCVRVSVFEIPRDGEIERSELYLGTLAPTERAGVLVKEGVTTLICGGMSEALDKMFQTSGISVIGGIAGPVDEVLEAFISGRIDESRYWMPGMEEEKHAPLQPSYEPAPQRDSVEAAKGSTVRRPSRHPSPPPKERANVRILLVGNDTASRRCTLDIFQESGCDVDAVTNGREAIKALESTTYDLVFMDAEMPEIDGYGTTRLIRNPQSPIRNHEVPIIAMTANVTKTDRERFIEAGMNDCITKPIQSERFLEVIDLILNKPTAELP